MPFRIWLSAFSICMLFPTIAIAERVAFQVEAVVDAAMGKNMDLLDFPVYVGDQVRGTYTLDTEALDVSQDPFQYRKYIISSPGSYGFDLWLSGNHFVTNPIAPDIIAWLESFPTIESKYTNYRNVFSVTSNNNLSTKSGMEIWSIDLSLNNHAPARFPKILYHPLDIAPDLSHFNGSEDSKSIFITGLDMTIVANVTSITLLPTQLKDDGPIFIVPSGSRILPNQRFDAAFYLSRGSVTDLVTSYKISLNNKFISCNESKSNADQQISVLCPNVSQLLLPGENIFRVEVGLLNKKYLFREVIWQK